MKAARQIPGHQIPFLGFDSYFLTQYIYTYFLLLLVAKTNRLYDDVVVKLPIIIQARRNHDDKDGDDDEL